MFDVGQVDTDGSERMENGDQRTPVWLECRMSNGTKQEEAFIRITQALGKQPPAFYVPARLVRPAPAPNESDGEVKVTLINRNNGSSVVEVPGEPVSFGPRIEVPTNLLKEG